MGTKRRGVPPSTERLRIKDAAERLRVSTATLRNWERKGVLRAERHPVNRYRLYRAEEIEKLRLSLPTGPAWGVMEAAPENRLNTNIIGDTTKKKIQGGISGLFGSRVTAEILKILVLSSGGALYQAEIAQRSGARLYLVQRALVRLEATGLITGTRRGNRVYYTPARSHPAFEDLRRFVIKTIAIGDALREALREFPDSVDVAFVFGSFASGDDRPDSDIDLMVVGSLRPRELGAVLGRLGRETGRQINPTSYTASALREKHREGDHFLGRVFGETKLFLIGNEDGLARLVG